MQDLLTIAEILALLCVSALCVYLIVVLARLKETLGHVEKDVKELAAHALPILENTEYITARLKSVAENVEFGLKVRKIDFKDRIPFGLNADDVCVIRCGNSQIVQVYGAGQHPSVIVIGMISADFRAAGRGEQLNLLSR